MGGRAISGRVSRRGLPSRRPGRGGPGKRLRVSEARELYAAAIADSTELMVAADALDAEVWVASDISPMRIGVPTDAAAREAWPGPGRVDRRAAGSQPGLAAIEASRGREPPKLRSGPQPDELCYAYLPLLTCRMQDIPAGEPAPQQPPTETAPATLAEAWPASSDPDSVATAVAGLDRDAALVAQSVVVLGDGSEAADVRALLLASGVTADVPR